jgi:hypothetical protein
VRLSPEAPLPPGVSATDILQGTISVEIIPKSPT